MIQHDIEFIGGNFYDISDIPKKEEYLVAYFSAREWHLPFLIYCLKMKGLIDEFGFKVFYQSFVDHTGYWVIEKQCWRTWQKFYRFHLYMEKKRKEGDFKTLSLIRAGKLKLTELGNLDVKYKG